MPVAAITLRSEKGSALTHDEMDLNWSRIEDFINALEVLLGAITNPDGSIKNNLVVTASIANRAVTTLKRSFDSGFYFVADGTANDLTIANPAGALMSAYPVGFAADVKTRFSNTGVATLAVDALAAVPIAKLNGQPLIAGDLPASSVIHVVYDGAVFVLQSASPQTNTMVGVVAQQGTTNSTPLTDSIQQIGSVSLTKPSGMVWSHISIVFTTSIQATPTTNGGISGFEVQIAGAPITGMVIAGNDDVLVNNAQMEMPARVTTEGVPTGHNTDTTLVLDVYLKKAPAPYNGNGDELTSRRLYAVGYYGLPG